MKLEEDAMTTEALSYAAPFLIRQDYAAYTVEQHAVWAELVRRVLPELRKHAAREYLDGFEIIGLEERLSTPSLFDQRAAGNQNRLEFHPGKRFSSRPGVF